MTTPNLLVERDGSIARVTLNQPDRGNALDLTMARALDAAAADCDDDQGIRCVILTGAGRMFCAGGDIGPFLAAGDDLPALLQEGAAVLHLAALRLARMAKPLVVLVNGPAAGAGFSLAIAGDIVLAAKSAYFTAAYGTIGLTPDGGMTWLLPRLVGLRRAQEIIFTNRRVTADEAESIGLVSRAVDDNALALEGMKVARSMADAATGTIGAARKLLMSSFHTGFEQQLECEAQAIGDAASRGDAREGLRAFADRRPPTFSGT